MTRAPRKSKGSRSGNEGGLGGIFAPEVRHRLDTTIEGFDDCFDEALTSPTAKSLQRLRGATASLMRSLARILIELERTRIMP